MEEYNIFLQSKNKHFHELDIIIQKIKIEFNILSMIIIDNDSYEFEITTQIYSKFLYLLSKISIKREVNFYIYYPKYVLKEKII